MTLTGLNYPIALAFDSSDNLYVANEAGTTVSKFTPGAIKPTATLTGLTNPMTLAFDTSGNLYVANYGSSTVSKFATGATSPTATLTGLSDPRSLAFDPSGNLYVANWGSGSGTTVSEFGAGKHNAHGHTHRDGQSDLAGVRLRRQPLRGQRGRHHREQVRQQLGRRIGWTPLSGDWDGNGTDSIALYNMVNSTFYFRNTNDAGSPDVTFTFGPAGGGWLPIVGDWDGNGTDTIGLYNPAASTFYLRNTISLQGSNDKGYADVAFGYGPAGGGWLPIAGNWTSTGFDTVGLYSPITSTFYLRNTNTTGYANVTFGFGPANGGWKPLAGDWSGKGTDTIGLYDPTASSFYLHYTNTTGFADAAFAYGPAAAGWIPLIGDWNGDGISTIGLFSPTSSEFFLRNSNTTGYATLTFAFGSGYDSLTSGISGAVASAAATPAALDASGLGNTNADTATPPTAEAGPQLLALDPRAVDQLDLSVAVLHGSSNVAGLNDFALSANALINGLPSHHVILTPS